MGTLLRAIETLARLRRPDGGTVGPLLAIVDPPPHLAVLATDATRLVAEEDRGIVGVGERLVELIDRIIADVEQRGYVMDPETRQLAEDAIGAWLDAVDPLDEEDLEAVRRGEADIARGDFMTGEELELLLARLRQRSA